MGDAIVRGFRFSFMVLFVERSAACTANRGRATPPAPEALDMEEDRDDCEDRVETSEIMESGEDADEVERAREDRRTIGG